MSSEELVGASLPEGIEVDEAAAYFGIVESSASLHTLLEMSPNEALMLFMEMTSDLHLAPGDFDFETASQRMNCEGGEIYYLVIGNLGMMKLADPLRRYLGMEDSEGEAGGPDPGHSAEMVEILEVLCDPMSLLKILAIAFMHGGNEAVERYIGGLFTMFSNPAEHLEDMRLVSSTLETVLHSFRGGNGVAPIPILAQSVSMPLQSALSGGKSAPVSKPSAVTKPKSEVLSKPEVSSKPLASPKPSSKTQVKPEVQPIAKSEPVSPVPLPGKEGKSIQESATTSPQVQHAEVDKSQSKAELVPLPIMQPAVKKTDERKDKQKEFDAFAGAFGISESPSSELDKVSMNIQQTPEEKPMQSIEKLEPQEVSSSMEEKSIENMLDSISTSGSTKSIDNVPPSINNSISVSIGQEVEPEVPSQPQDSEQLLSSQSSEITEAITQDVEQELLQNITNDAKSSLSSEAKSSSGLPKPIRASPVRAPVVSQTHQSSNQVEPNEQFNAQYSSPQQPSIQQQQATLAAQQAAAQQAAAQQAAAQQAAAQQAAAQQAAAQQAAHQQAQQAAQSYQPTIRSGVHCQGCGIGLDPTWNHCPVCGTASV